MRPSDIQTGTNVYECFDCGARTEAPDGTRCAECGAELLRLGRSRDL
jgi:DNA-directed RNA polymerase subunit RPC12/RpoP